MPVTAIIPARGGSKGIPRKNLQEINGVSLLAIAIRKCQQVADRVIVSTDDDEIAVVALLENAEVIRRPAYLATDDAKTIDALQDVVASFGVTGEVLTVQCTAPLASADDYQAVIDGRLGADVAFAVHEFHGYVIGANGAAITQPMIGLQPRQQAAKQYIIAGSAWSCDARHFVGGELYAGQRRMVVVPGPVCDIDTPEDLEIARRLYGLRREPCRHQHQWHAAAEALGGGAYATDVIGITPNAATNDAGLLINEDIPQSGDGLDCDSSQIIRCVESVSIEGE